MSDYFTEGPIDPRIYKELATDMWRLAVSYLPIRDVLKLPRMCKYFNEEVVWHPHSGPLLWGEMNLEELLFAERPKFPPCRPVLMRACEYSAPLSHIMCLINGRADVNAVDEDYDILNNGGGHTALLFASSGNENTVRALLKANANPNLYNYTGQTPLMLAQNDRVVSALLEGGADPNYVTNFVGDTALKRLLYKTDEGNLRCLQKDFREKRITQCENMIRVLVNSKADVDLKIYHGKTALEYAHSIKSPDSIIRILERAQKTQTQK